MSTIAVTLSLVQSITIFQIYLFDLDHYYLLHVGEIGKTVLKIAIFDRNDTRYLLPNTFRVTMKVVTLTPV